MRWLLLGITIFMLLPGCQKKAPPLPVRPAKAMQLKEKGLVSLHAFPGRTRAVDRVNLSFRVEGQLIERPVYVGDHVLQGELLARLDPRDFEVQLENELGRLEKTEADLRFAQRDYERGVNIWEQDPGAISESLLDQKLEERNRLQGELKSLEAAVDHAEDLLSYTNLLSPFEGDVVATYAQNYEYVKAKQPIIRLLNTSQVEMVIDVPESLIADIPYVDRVLVEFDAIPGAAFSAEVKEMGTEASTTTRTYPVTLLIDQPEDETIYAGMAGQAVLFSTKISAFNEEGFLVPPSSLFTDDALDTTYVWLIDPETMRVYKQEVTRGRLTSQGMIITEGLHAGDWVITAGVSFLNEGQEVTIMPVELDETGKQVPIASEGE